VVLYGCLAGLINLTNHMGAGHYPNTTPTQPQHLPQHFKPLKINDFLVFVVVVGVCHNVFEIWGGGGCVQKSCQRAVGGLEKCPVGANPKTPTKFVKPLSLNGLKCWGKCWGSVGVPLSNPNTSKNEGVYLIYRQVSGACLSMLRKFVGHCLTYGQGKVLRCLTKPVKVP
jgi:hypothetical protein